MSYTRCQKWSASVLGILGGLFLSAALFLFFGFTKFYDDIINKNLVLSQDEDGYLSAGTFWYLQPPTVSSSNFYFFNVENIETVEYKGAKPKVTEIGPFNVRNFEGKFNYSLSEDGNLLRFKNYKSFFFNQNNSCVDCTFESLIVIPNMVTIGATEAMLDHQLNNVSDTTTVLINLITLTMGEYAFVQVKVGDLLFDGYDDSMLAAAHSRFVRDLSDIFNDGKTIVPIPLPDMKKMAFFFGYNNTNDQEFEVYTGKKNLDKLGQIHTWASHSQLPEKWGTDERSRQIRGSDSGAFVRSGLRKTDRIEFFQSYLCRSFDLSFLHENTINGIDTYVFGDGAHNFDTTLPDQAGFRYSNTEDVDYYPDWPNCTESGRRIDDCSSPDLDCAIVSNMCSLCCKGSKVNGVRLLPPGMYPINCYPGQYKETPFRLLYTTPHFSSSPKEVRQSIDGLHELGEEGQPFMYNYLPRAGSPLSLNLRFQIAMPIYRTDKNIVSSHLPNKIFPIVWVDSSAKLNDYALNTMYTAFVLVPRIANVLKYVFVGLGLLLIVMVVIVLKMSQHGGFNLTANRHSTNL